MPVYKVFETVEYSYEYEADSEDAAIEMMVQDQDMETKQQFIGVTERYAVLADEQAAK